MTKFRVRLLETVSYTVDVEAKDAEAAAYIASEIWAESPNPTKDFDGQGQGVEAETVTPDPQNWKGAAEQPQHDLPTRARAAAVTHISGLDAADLVKIGAAMNIEFGEGAGMNIMRRGIIDRVGDWVEFCTTFGIAISPIVEKA